MLWDTQERKSEKKMKDMDTWKEKYNLIKHKEIDCYFGCYWYTRGSIEGLGQMDCENREQG